MEMILPARIVIGLTRFYIAQSVFRVVQDNSYFPSGAVMTEDVAIMLISFRLTEWGKVDPLQPAIIPISLLFASGELLKELRPCRWRNKQDADQFSYLPADFLWIV